MGILNVPWVNSFSNKRLDMILLITEQCNFRCVYCYEDFKLGKMTPDIIEGVKNIIKSRGELETLNLSFFGGEPLLNTADIIELSNWAKQFCKIHKVNYTGNITTNGYLLDKKIFEKLIQSDVTLFQITLDGEQQTHDKYRPTVNNKSTFNKIYSNLINMAKSNHNFVCSIRFNIADSNFNSIKSFIDNYSTPFANDNRFSFHFHPIFGMSHIKLTKAEGRLKELEELAAIKAFRFKSPYDYPLCYASQANSFVIRANGIVQKCTVALKSEINNIGKIGKDGSLNINEEKFKKWVFADNKGCPLRSVSLEKHSVPYEDAGKYINNVSTNT